MNELDIYDRQGFGNQSDFGTQLALLVVDFVNGFANPDEFGGENIGETVVATKMLLQKTNTTGIPIAFSRMVYTEDGSNAGIFCLNGVIETDGVITCQSGGG